MISRSSRLRPTPGTWPLTSANNQRISNDPSECDNVCVNNDEIERDEIKIARVDVWGRRHRLRDDVQCARREQAVGGDKCYDDVLCVRRVRADETPSTRATVLHALWGSSVR